MPPSAVPRSSPTAYTAGATGAMTGGTTGATGGTTGATGAKIGATASSTHREGDPRRRIGL